MPTVKNILDFLFDLAPEHYKMDWDNVGLMCGHSDREVTKILVALDASLAVAEEAKALGCELAVVHHPLIFTSTHTVSDETVTGVRLLRYLENGLAVISMHTNLDCAPEGVNDVLADRLGLKNVQVLEDGEMSHLVRYGEVPGQALAAFLPFVKSQLSCEGLRYADGGRPVKKVAVGGGACGDYLEQLQKLGCDTFVTADVNYHRFADAEELGINLIDAGHFETENPVVWQLRAKLSEAFPELTVLVSENHRDATHFA